MSAPCDSARLTPARLFGMKKSFVGVLLACLTLTGCSQDSGQHSGGDANKPTSKPTPVENTQQVTTTGSAFLNGYQIVPEGTQAVCATHEGSTTVIIGEMPSKNAASAIIDARGVQALSVVDAEDAVEFTDYSYPANVERQDGVITISGEIEGTRMLGGQPQRVPMTFVINAACG